MNPTLIGFGLTGVIIAIYALQFRFYFQKYNISSNFYSLAYIFLALAFFVWSATPLDKTYLRFLFITSYACIFMASLLLVTVLYQSRPKVQLTLSVITTVVLLTLLWFINFYSPPFPFFLEGVVIFNLPTITFLFLALITLTIWLPANYYVADKLAILQPGNKLSQVFKYAHTGFAASFLVLIAAPTLLVSILAIIAIWLFVVMLIYIILNKQLIA